jgi:hypothetical protein
MKVFVAALVLATGVWAGAASQQVPPPAPVKPFEEASIRPCDPDNLPPCPTARAAAAPTASR